MSKNSTDWISNPTLQKYLLYVEDTESPRMMHIWSLISCAGAAMGRHAWIDIGIGPMFGNQFILLVGPPGTRKSTAIKIAKDLLKNATAVKFAPKDTGGKRQGLISAMTGAFDAEESKDWLDGITDEGLANLDAIEVKVGNSSDRHCIYICASEFGSFIGQNNLELTRFLLEMWDGEDYPYQLRNQKYVLDEPLASMIGGTTPTDIATLLPREAIGQGFTARCVMIFEPKKYKSVPPSKIKLLPELEKQFESIFSWIQNEMVGEIKFSANAAKLSDKIYAQEININDPRFMYYSERRHTHLVKLALCLAALRMSKTIESEDIQQANVLLEHAEENMPDALGEYGMSPLALSKQKIVEYLQHANQPITLKVLQIILSKDMKLLDLRNCLNDLINAGKIAEVTTTHGKAFVYRDTTFEALQLLSDDDDIPTPLAGDIPNVRSIK